MKKIYTLIAATLFCFSVKAQTPAFNWSKSMGGTAGDNGLSIAVDGSGNVYTTGIFGATSDFDPGVGVFNMTATGTIDIFISKLDALGNFVWAKQFGGTGSNLSFSLAVDVSGNAFITGQFTSTTDFDPGVGVFNLTPVGTGDIFVSKLDALGNFVWAKQLGRNGNGQSLALDASGNVYTTGPFSATGDYDPGIGTFNLTPSGGTDIFISKLDASGNFVWAKRIGGTSADMANAISIDNIGNVYTTGYFQLTVDFNPGVGTFNMTSAGSRDAFVSKLDASGNFVWAKQLGGASSEEGYSIVTDAIGSVYSTGIFNLTADFDPGVGVLNMTSAGASDIFISKLDASGNLVFAKQIGGAGNDYSTGISLDAANNIYTTGFFANTPDFDPGVGIFTLTYFGLYDAFISKLDVSGNFVWAGQLGGIDDDRGNSIAVDAVGNIYSTGYFTQTGDFDAGVAVFNMTAITNSYDSYVTKYCPTLPTQPGTISGPTTVCNGATNAYSITSVSGATSYTWVLPGGWSGTSTTTSINTTASSTGGTISVTANNACGSSTAQTFTVSVNNVSTGMMFTPALCNGSCNGDAMSMPTGTGPFTYLWNNTQTAQTATGLCAGNYTVTVTGAGGCSATGNVTVTQPTVLSATSSSTFTTCGTCCDGTATVNATGGTPVYSYVWTPSGGNAPIATGLCNGTYTVCVTDANGCTTCSTVNVSFNVGIQQATNENELIIYPNPFQNEFTIVGLGSSIVEVKLFDVIGKQIMEWNGVTDNQQLITDNLLPGIYFIKIISSEGTLTKKIVKD